MGLARSWIPGWLVCLAAVVVCPAAEPWRFVVTCDSRGDILTGVNERILFEIAQEIVRQDADFLIYPGDLVYGARVSPYQFERQLWTWVRTMRSVYDVRIPVYVCRGNHEVGDMWDAEPNQLPNPADNYSLRWLRVFGSEEYPEQRLPGNGPANARHMSYSVVHKNALIVALDQYGGVTHRLAHQVDQAWLDGQLKSNTKPHVFVFGHEPAFRVVHPDCLDDFPAQRDEFWRSLEAAKARMYFSGHDHFYNHARIDAGDGNPDNDVHQLVIATAGAPGYTWVPPYVGENGDFTVIPLCHFESYGYVLVEVDGLHVTATWMERRSPILWEPGFYEARHTWSYIAAAGPIVTQPNGGEQIPAGKAYPVTWRTLEGGDTHRVAIEYSLDGGGTWTVAGEADNVGEFLWLAPSAQSQDSLIRVTDLDHPEIYDVSDRPFAMVDCDARPTADLNKDGRVDLADLAILAGQWLSHGSPRHDPGQHPEP